MILGHTAITALAPQGFPKIGVSRAGLHGESLWYINYIVPFRTSLFVPLRESSPPARGRRPGYLIHDVKNRTTSARVGVGRTMEHYKNIIVAESRPRADMNLRTGIIRWRPDSLRGMQNRLGGRIGDTFYRSKWGASGVPLPKVKDAMRRMIGVSMAA